MKVLLVNGSPHTKGNTYKALNETAGVLEQNGIEVKWFNLGNKPVRGCIDCKKCDKNYRCVFNDDPCNELIEDMLECDGVIIGTPTYFAGPNGALLAVLDRVFYAASESAYLFKGKPAAAVAVAWRAGTTAAIDRINKYFTYAQMPIVSSMYWNNIVHGSADALGDAYGVSIMKQLGQNMADLLKK